MSVREDSSRLHACGIVSVPATRVCCLLCVFFFFVQAEDGRRDAQESRGLGDVYKRQGKAVKVAKSQYVESNATISRPQSNFGNKKFLGIF